MKPTYYVVQRGHNWIIKSDCSDDAMETFDTQGEAQTKCDEMNDDFKNRVIRIRI